MGRRLRNSSQGRGGKDYPEQKADTEHNFMDLFGYSKGAISNWTMAMRQIEVLARSLNAAYSLSQK